MSFSPERCPLCGQPNDCARAAQPDSKGACWCVKETFPPELCARVPEKARRCACICQRCLAEAQREKQSHASAGKALQKAGTRSGLHGFSG